MNHDTSLTLPYTGLRILDISQGIAGPYCAHILWQQGADVTKVEPPSGDWGRFVGVVRGEHSALSVQYNAGKRSIAIDGKVQAGRALLRQLALQSDIVVQNFRPGVAERMGLGYVELAALKPDLLYVSISGYGPDGPYADAPASDSVMQADSGLMVTNQDQHGAPRRIGMLMADVATGLYAAQAASAALYQRLARGAGSHVEVSLFEACASLQGINFLEHAMAGQRPFGAVSAPNGVFETADGQLTLLALNNDQFARVCRALGQEAWLTDTRFADNTCRMAHAEFLHAAINTLLKLQPTAFWMAQLQAHDVLHAPVRGYDAVMAHPQASHVQMFQPLAQPGLGSSFAALSPLPYLGLPATPFRRKVGAAPRIGEHSVQILVDAGFDAEHIEQWTAAGVVCQAAAAA